MSGVDDMWAGQTGRCGQELEFSVMLTPDWCPKPALKFLVPINNETNHRMVTDDKNGVNFSAPVDA